MNNQIYAFSSSVYELSRIAKLAVEVVEQLRPELTNNSKFERERLTKAPYLHTLLDTLVSQQFPDGSWGSNAYSFGDRLINTLGAVTALAFNKRRWLELQEKDAPNFALNNPNSSGQTFFPRKYQQSFQAGISWLETSVVMLEWYNPDKDDLADLAGLELVVYALRDELICYREQLAELSTLALYLNQLSNSAPVLKKARLKLQLIPRELVFQPGSAISFILEFSDFLVEASPTELAKSLTARGSIGNSPSTTAYVLDQSWTVLTASQRSQILNYLREGAQDSQAATGQPGWGSHYPMNHFLEIWHKYYLKQLHGLDDAPQLPGETTPDLALLDTIQQQARMGFGADYDFQIDADTTAAFIYLAAETMVQQGQTNHLFSLLECLLEFFDSRKGYFLTYPFELTPSVTTNVHVWQALDVFLKLTERGLFDAFMLPSTLQPEPIREIKNSLAVYIKNQFRGENLWQDKWHMTPSYVTSHIVASGLLEEEPDGYLQLNQIVRTVLQAQSPLDGGWGYVKLQDASSKASEKRSNPDDTLHTLLLLLYSLKNKAFISGSATTEPDDQLLPALGKAIFRAIAYLSPLVEQANPQIWPALWCDKTLYSPYGLLQIVAEQLLDQLNARKLHKWQVA